MSIRNRRKRIEPRRRIIDAVAPKAALWYIVIPVVLLLSLTAPWRRTVGNFFAPYLNVAASAGDKLADQTLKLRSRTELAKEVERLNLQNIRLQNALNEAKDALAENRQLRTIMKLQNPPGYDYIPCSVVLRDPWMWDSGFTIDRGSRDGMQPGLAVIAPVMNRNGQIMLLGVIERVDKYTSHVMSILNPEFRISASLPESGAVGFLNSAEDDTASGGAATIGFLPANRTFALNELIFTTGFESGIPGNLLIGSLDSIEPAALPFGNRLYRRGVLRPAADLEHLRTVIVAQINSQKQPDRAGDE